MQAPASDGSGAEGRLAQHSMADPASGWPAEDWPGFVACWRRACVVDAVLGASAGPWSVRFGMVSGLRQAVFAFAAGRALPPDDTCADPTASVDFAFSAPQEAWAGFLAPVPPRHHHSPFAMRMRVPGVALLGDELRFAQFCHLLRRVLEIGKWLALGRALPVPPSLRPSLPRPAPPAAIRGGYLPVPAGGTVHSIFHEQAGEGPAILCLHTAGADTRQFHRLMADPRLAGWRLVAFDLPWHGKSPPPPGAVPGSWRLSTELYVELVMGFIAAAGLERPVVLGASMSGEICLELALRHPDRFAGIVACEASDHVQGRQVAWAAHPQVNQTVFVPEWIHGLMAPQSPAECAEEVWWHYSQGGSATFAGDIDFYSREWDARDRVGGIDTGRCPLFMLTGEYDYSCTAERSAETAAKIAGARFQTMPGLGHFPFAENPPLFAGFLLPILRQIAAMAP
jgi:pimeloyl-ACP methyl ester carboxylesterase